MATVHQCLQALVPKTLENRVAELRNIYIMLTIARNQDCLTTAAQLTDCASVWAAYLRPEQLIAFEQCNSTLNVAKEVFGKALAEQGYELAGIDIEAIRLAVLSRLVGQDNNPVFPLPKSQADLLRHKTDESLQRLT